MSRKGTEAPIEIFVALFVILAVALVMLKLFNSQVTEKQKQLADVDQAQKAQEMLSNVRLSCQQKCTDASNTGCSLRAMAALCLSNSGSVLKEGEFVDFNGNNLLDYNVDALGGVGVCEDKVYCFNLLDSCCARKITPESCASILNQFWNNKGYNQNQKKDLCDKYLNKGTCTTNNDEFAWWNTTEYKNLCEK